VTKYRVEYRVLVREPVRVGPLTIDVGVWWSERWEHRTEHVNAAELDALLARGVHVLFVKESR